MLQTLSLNGHKSVPKLGPVVTTQQRNVNTSMHISCSVQDGTPPFFFEWSKNGKGIRTGSGVKWEIENNKKLSTLTIDRIDKEDAGNYSCMVKNVYGSDSIHVNLTVKGMPVLIYNYSITWLKIFSFCIK